jgi:hypothetical protein
VGELVHDIEHAILSPFMCPVFDEGPGACSGPFLTSDPVLGRRDVSSAHRKPIEIHGTKVITSVPISSIDR